MTSYEELSPIMKVLCVPEIQVIIIFALLVAAIARSHYLQKRMWEEEEAEK